MTAWTRVSVSGRSSSGLFSALDTVWRETPASSATVARVGGTVGLTRSRTGSGRLDGWLISLPRRFV